jgi:hypothetical protein
MRTTDMDMRDRGSSAAVPAAAFATAAVDGQKGAHLLMSLGCRPYAVRNSTMADAAESSVRPGACALQLVSLLLSLLSVMLLLLPLVVHSG